MQYREGTVRTKRARDGGRSRIVAAARHFFAQKGFHQTGMAELAARAEVSIGQVYRLFTNKSDIIIAIVQEDADQRLAEMDEVNAAVGDGRLSIREGIEKIVSNALGQGGEALTFEILAEGSRNPQAGDVIGRFCERYRKILRELALHANPRLDGDRLAAAEEILLACLFGLGNRALSRPTLPLAQTAKLTSDFIYVALQ